MSWTFNTDKVIFKEWVEADDPNIFRFHISHTDLDGYGCQVVSQCALRSINIIKYPVVFSNVRPGCDYEVIDDFLRSEKTRPYIKGESQLFILISDLGSIDLSYYAAMIDAGHIIRLIVVDHHATTFKNMTDEDVHKGYTMTYFGTNVMSSTLQMWHLLLWSKININSKVIGPLKAYCQAVSKYDTGDWDNEWYERDKSERNVMFKYIPTEIYEQLRFIAYRKNKKMNMYIHDMVYFLAVKKPSGLAVKNIDIRREHNNLCEEYERFISNIIDFTKSKPTVPVLTYTNHEGIVCDMYVPNYVVKGVIINSPEEDYNYFSLISSRVLEYGYDDINEDIDILILINHVRHNIELRTDRDDLNLARIAKLNGGGGHPKAAGFPIK